MGFSLYRSDKRSKRVKKMAFMYIACAFFNWITAFLFFYIPVAFVYINWLLLLSYILVQIFFYGFVFEITRITSDEKFPLRHYMLPLIFGLFALVVSLFTPFDEQLQSIANREVYSGHGSYLYYLACNKRFEIRLLFTIVYTILSFRRIARFNRFNKNLPSSDKNSIKWVSACVFFSVILIITPILSIVLSRESVIASHMLTLQVLVLILQYSFLSIFITNQQILNFEPETNNNVAASVSKDEKNNIPQPVPLKKAVLNRETFENYILTKKPYKNPDLKITDLVNELNVNRTYISGFINAEYGVNFNNYINQCRLAEFKQLKTQKPALTEAELAEMSGFSSYRSFKRFEAANEV